MRSFFILFLLFFFLSANLTAEEWSKWRGPNGNGTWYEPRISKKLPINGLKRIWKTSVFPGYSGVTVKNGLVYTMDRPDTGSGVGLERILCLDVKTGEVVWIFSYPVDYRDLGYGKGPRSSVCIVNDRVFSFGAMGDVVCLDSQSGKKIWMRNLVEDENATIPIWGFSSTPEPLNNEILLNAGCKPVGLIISLCQKTGETKWKVGKDEKAGYAPPLEIISPSGGQLLVWGPNQIMGLPIGSGESYWEVPYKVKYGVSITKPIYYDGVVLVSGFWHGTRAIQLGEKKDEAKILWSNELGLRGLMSQPLLRRGVCYLLDRSRGLTAFEYKTGEIFWADNHNLTPSERNPHASIIWTDQENGEALALNALGELVFMNLNRDGFKEYWREQIVSKTWAHPAYSKEFIFSRDDQSIYCYELPLDHNN